MVDIYASDAEKIQAIKKWWKDNGKSTMVGIVIGLGIVLGWRGWVEHGQTRAEHASVLYDELRAALEQDDTDAVAALGEQIIGKYDSTPYATLAAFGLAKQGMEQGDVGVARGHLQWVLDHTKQEELRHVARLRLVRVLLQENQIEQARALLSGVVYGAFEGQYAELIGDLSVAEQQPEQAREAYAKALLAGGGNSAFVQMKLDDLGGNEQ